MSTLSDQIEELISEHLEKQPYSVACENCGNALKFTKEVDSDDDLLVSVDPCETCMKEARESE